MSKPLPKKLRARWDALVATEGAGIGLSKCRVFLENKLVNDIFYHGEFNGVPCVVKCSSRAPGSIRNEYEMSRRLSSVAPVCAEALAHWESADRRMAFVVIRRLPGPSLTDILARGVEQDEAVDILEDMVSIAEALQKSGIVWRDIIPDNFLLDADGHLKLIDAQFAIDRRDFHEDPYMLSHWKYRTLLFAHHPMMAGHGWNDVAMMLHFVRGLSRWELSHEVFNRLQSYAGTSAFPVKHGMIDYLGVFAVCLQLSGRLLFTLSRRKREVLRQRRMRTMRFLTGRTEW